jgi:hypothetical protein
LSNFDALQARPPSDGAYIFRNYTDFHHSYYSKDHLVSRTYMGDEGDNTPYFFIPVFLVLGLTYFLLPLDRFIAQSVACAASLYAYVFFNKEAMLRGRACESSHGSGASRNCTSLITDTRAVTMR